MKKWTDWLFVIAVLVILLIGLGKTIFFPNDINVYENRYAVKLKWPDLRGYLDESVQSNAEEALNDQIPFASNGKRLYNYANSVLVGMFYKHTPIMGRYINFENKQNVCIFSQTLVYKPLHLPEIKAALDERIKGYNNIFEDYPNTDFFLYFIEKDTDIDFETGEKLGAFEYLKDRLNLQESHIGRFRIDSFEEFSDQFFHTDHHWNCRGSYRAYCEVLTLLGCTDDPIAHSNEIGLSSYKGSKANSVFNAWQEQFFAYRYDFPAFKSIQINSELVEDYGAQEAYLDQVNNSAIAYGTFYGGDEGEIIFDSGREDCGNLLILGESFDNALLKLIACHFDKTYCVDLRFYESFLGKEFSLQNYLAENEIDKVLFIGNVNYFKADEFLPEE